MHKAKIFLSLALTVAIASSVGLTACSGGREYQEIDAYKGDTYDNDTEFKKVEFDHEIFRRNDFNGIGPDPFIFDNTSRDGYYYAYSTTEYFFAYRSKDLAHWEPVGNVLDPFGNDEMVELTWDYRWAPEMLWDEDREQYLFIFSCGPKGTSWQSQLMCGYADSPTGPFIPLNFKDPDEVGAENVHDYDMSVYNDYYDQYRFLDPGEIFKLAKKCGKPVSDGFHGENIDAHPYVAPDGTKYLYWAMLNATWGVEMENWLKPKWETANIILASHFYTIEDYYKNLNGQTVERIPYERADVNEGPEMLYHKGKFYLTYSMNGYGDNDYQVGQAIADNPLGPFRKLTADENGVFLSGAFQGSEEVSGSGHHSFVTSGDQLYIFYHRHNDFDAGGGPRNSVIDEVVWLPITDINGEEIDVLYTNGPSTSVQPMITGHTDYVNVAQKATLWGGDLVKDSSLKWLNDGILSSYATENPVIDKYAQETEIANTSTITLDFDKPQDIRAIMVYNSKNARNTFRNILKIEIDDAELPVTYVINDVKFDETLFRMVEFNGQTTIQYVSPCAAAFAQFDEIKTTRVRITVEVPEGQQKVGISEIRILGKAEAEK